MNKIQNSHSHYSLRLFANRLHLYANDLKEYDGDDDFLLTVFGHGGQSN